MKLFHNPLVDILSARFMLLHTVSFFALFEVRMDAFRWFRNRIGTTMKLVPLI